MGCCRCRWTGPATLNLQAASCGSVMCFHRQQAEGDQVRTALHDKQEGEEEVWAQVRRKGGRGRYCQPALSALPEPCRHAGLVCNVNDPSQHNHRTTKRTSSSSSLRSRLSGTVSSMRNPVPLEKRAEARGPCLVVFSDPPANAYRCPGQLARTRTPGRPALLP